MTRSNTFKLFTQIIACDSNLFQLRQKHTNQKTQVYDVFTWPKSFGLYNDNIKKNEKNECENNFISKLVIPHRSQNVKMR